MRSLAGDSAKPGPRRAAVGMRRWVQLTGSLSLAAAAAAAVTGAGSRAGAAAPVSGLAPGALEGVGWTNTLVCNVDPSAAGDATLVLRGYGWGLTQMEAHSFSTGSVPPGQCQDPSLLPAWQRLNHDLYAGRVEAHGPIVAASYVYWEASGAHADLQQAAAATDLLVPWVAKRFDRQTSVIGIQNTDVSVSAVVFVTFYGADGAPSGRLATSIMPGAGVLLDLRSDHDPKLAALPCGFHGSARIESTAPVAAQVLGDLGAASRGVYGYEAVPVAATSRDLDLPLVGNAPDLPADYNPFESRIVVTNAGEWPAAVDITYRGIGGVCTGQRIGHAGGRRYEVPPHGAAVFEQGPRGADRPTGASGLPAGCSAAAVVRSVGAPVAAVALLGDGRGRFAAAYGGIDAGLAASRAIVPMYQNQNGRERVATELVVMNPGTSPVAASVAFLDTQARPVPCIDDRCVARIPAGQSVAWFVSDLLADDREMNSRYGSAAVTSDGPVHVLVGRYSASHDPSVQDDMAFSLAATPPAEGDSTASTRFAPLTLWGAVLPAPDPCRAMLPVCLLDLTRWERAPEHP